MLPTSTTNKTLALDACGILQYNIWYQSRERLVLRWGDYKIPHRKRASIAKALLVMLVANMVYAFWGHAWLPGTKPWGGPGWKPWTWVDWEAQSGQYTACWARPLHYPLLKFGCWLYKSAMDIPLLIRCRSAMETLLLICPNFLNYFSHLLNFF
jgi:hypothetical protein